jgi:hypothetical protein
LQLSKVHLRRNSSELNGLALLREKKGRLLDDDLQPKEKKKAERMTNQVCMRLDQ